MNGKYRILFFNLIIYIFIISLSFYLTLNSKFIYLLVIKFHQMDNDKYILYKYVIEFLNSPNQYDLHIENYHISKNVIVHFQDVKNIIEYNNIILMLSGLIVFFIYLEKPVLFLLNPFKLTLKYKVSLILMISFILIDFKEVFYFIHIIIFRNSYWLIDASKDPIINIFPAYYFQYFFFLMIFYFAVGILFIQLIRKNFINKSTTRID